MAKSSSSKESVTRVKATSTKKSKKTTPTDKSTKTSSVAAVKKPAKNSTDPKSRNPIVAFIGYFKGAWYELRQVRWPNRRATWSLTGAVLAFSAFFVVLILLLDSLFKYIFELILQ